MIFTFLVFFSLAGSGSAAQVTLAWDANTEADLTGYKMYFGTESHTYGAPIDVGLTTTWTVSNLLEGQTYYFAVTAYDGADRESCFSNEVRWTAPTPNNPPLASAGADQSVYEGNTVSLDGRGSRDPENAGVSCRWVQTSGPPVTLFDPATAMPTFTAPAVAAPGAILTFTLIVEDAVGLSAADSVSISVLDQPPPAQTAPVSSSVYEDGEDGATSGWMVYGSNPAGATITNVYDQARQSRVISLQGAGPGTGYLLRNDAGGLWGNNRQFVLRWSMQFFGAFSVYVDVQTTAGHRCLAYKPHDWGPWGAGEYVEHGIGRTVVTGKWRTVVRDLQADLEEVQPGVMILEVNGFEMNGSGLVDDIELFDVAPPTVYEDAEDETTGGWIIYYSNPGDATINNVFEGTPWGRVIQVQYATGRLRNDDGSLWHNNHQFVLQWSMSTTGVGCLYADVRTTAGHRFLVYTARDTSSLGTGEYVHHGIGSAIIDGEWRSFVRDLRADLGEAQPGVAILEVNGFLVRGSALLDDLSLRRHLD